ncbi:MAG: hypothetical protein NVSMB20_13930 [Bradyrhizobium sp.]
MTLTDRLAIAMILLVTIAVTAVGWLSYRSLEQALLPRVLDRIETHSRLVAADLRSHVRGARADIATFQSLATIEGMTRARLNGGIDPIDLTPEAAWRDRLQVGLAAQLKLKPAYSQLSFIGIEDGGREIVRVDRSGPNGSIRVVPDTELGRAGETPCFTNTIRLSADAIYVSPIDLNAENHVAETPYVPTMRVASPVFKPDGKPFGIVVINIDMRPALDRVRSSVRQGDAVYVINERGDYLVHPDPAREFGSRLGKPADWRRDFPYFAASLGAMQSVAQIAPDQTGQPGGAALAPAVLAGSEWVAVIETVPNAVFMAPAEAIQNTTLLVGFIAVLCAAALAVFVANSLTRPISQLTAAVEGIDKHGPVAIPLDAGGETGVLARAFSRVMDEARAKTAALEHEVRQHRRTEAARDHHAAREHLFSSTVESSNDAIITKSLDGTITGWNPAAERLFGHAAIEAVGKSIDLIVPSDRTTEVHDILRRIGWGETIEHYETVRLRNDGSPVEVALSVSPIKNSAGAIVGASKTARDITESKRTRQALRQQIEERRRIFETSQDLILVTDPKGTLVQVSPSSEAILGYAPQEMVGRIAIDFIHGDDLDGTRGEMRAARRGHRTRNFDSRYVHKDGRVVTLSWMGTWSEPVGRHFFIGRDMTESRLAQETLRESEQLARGIIDNALDAFIQMNESGIILDWNSQAENVFGWSRAEAVGKPLQELIIPEMHRAAHQAGLERSCAAAKRPSLGAVLKSRRGGATTRKSRSN